MPNPESIAFEYKNRVTVLVEMADLPKQPKISISPEKIYNRLRREALAIGIGYAQMYQVNGHFPSLEEAREFAAVVCMSPTAFGDLTDINPRRLADMAQVTEEFAQYRISIDQQVRDSLKKENEEK